ncbi:phage tail termination protein [Nocardia fusca]|uniref:Tail terminator n=1 Tax=Nocardia fusca TaxID=941183 RepID=A0ABV3FIH7_9NOCA
MIAFPDWWEGGYPDAELVVLDLAQTYLDMLTPAGMAVSYLTADHTELVDSGTPVVRVYRGGTAENRLFDPAAVQLGVIARTRRDSWEVLEYLRQVLRSFKSGGAVRREDGSLTMIQSVSEIVGPQQLPELNPDHRLVPATFRVTFRYPRDMPDYAAIRESLPL